MQSSNPRKTMRKNIYFLDAQIAELNRRKRKFEAEKQRLLRIEKESPIEEVDSSNRYWNQYNWYAFPESL